MLLLLVPAVAAAAAVAVVSWCYSGLVGVGGGGHGGAGRVQGAGHERQHFKTHAGRARNFPRCASTPGGLGRSSGAKWGTLGDDVLDVLLYTM